MNGPRLLLIACALALTAFGAVVQAGLHETAAAFPWSHPAWSAGGLAAMLAAARIDVRFWFRLAPQLLAVALCASVVLLPHNGRRDAGPVVLLALALILFLASWRGGEVRRRAWTASGLVAALLFAVALAVLWPAFGAAVALLLTGLVLLLLRGYGGAAAATAVLALGGLVASILNSPQRLHRVLALLAPERYASRCEPPFHFALEAGGWTGVGLGNGTHLTAVPGAARAFMAAHIGEELGRAGLFAVLFVLATLMAAGLVASLRAPDPRARTFGIGIVAWIAFQALLHLGVVFQWLPIVSVPLPLAGSAGVELVVLLAGVGVLAGLTGGEREDGVLE